MPESGDVIRGYLQAAIAAETSVETQFRAFAQEGDDEEVRASFAEHADETRRQYDRLNSHLGQLGGASSFHFKSALPDIFSLVPELSQSSHTPEERIAHNLIVGFAVTTSRCAMYEALAAITEAAGVTATASLAREIQAQKRRAAEHIWRFLPSRSKIAFNMLTAGEIDPSIETRAMVDRIV